MMRSNTDRVSPGGAQLLQRPRELENAVARGLPAPARLSASLLRAAGEVKDVTVQRAHQCEGSVPVRVVEERNRIAREIHDTLAQTLSGITLQLETAEALLQAGADPARAAAAVSIALTSARASLEDVRRSVLDLRPAPLEGRTIGGALRQLVADAAGRSNATMRYDLAGDTIPLPAAVEAGLYRVAQEAVSNALRHSGASTILVRLEVDSEEVRLHVGDDGCGLDGRPRQVGRFGLVGMRERVRLLGGVFDLRSSPGEGTCLFATVPLKERT